MRRNSNVYVILKVNLGEGLRMYRFTGDTTFSKVEAREVDANGDVIAVGGGISVPSKEFKKMLRDSRPRSASIIY